MCVWRSSYPPDDMCVLYLNSLLDQSRCAAALCVLLSEFILIFVKFNPPLTREPSLGRLTAYSALS